MNIPTVKIKHPSGYAIINESDFNAEVHELYEAPKAEPKKKPKKPKK